jgi:hypothetical protein
MKLNKTRANLIDLICASRYFIKFGNRIVLYDEDGVLLVQVPRGILTWEMRNGENSGLWITDVRFGAKIFRLNEPVRVNYWFRVDLPDISADRTIIV